MERGIGWWLCFLVMFISANHAENVDSSQDLIKGDISETGSQEESRSGAFSESSAYVNEGAHNSVANSADALSRVIPQSEYVIPHRLPGAENIITCSREGELHNFWSSSYECLVCACIREYGLLRPVCASCSRCMMQIHKPEPPSIVIQVPTTPPPETQVSCHPFPSGLPFQNPLHPCQICTCTELVNPLGKPDVYIECQENPQCVLPLELSTLPPIPEVPGPIPLATCENFPQNVLFPHPTDTCKVCKCSVEILELGIPEQHITCYPKPDCAQKPIVVQELITLPPEPYVPQHPVADLIDSYSIQVPITPEPIPFPDIATPGPVVWPPATTLAPPHLPGTGPLPGPSPHESCRPYVSNQPFQHPWDECQICVCIETFTVGHITIEVNCYTKKSCCLETSASIEPALLPGGDVTSQIQSLQITSPGKIQLLDTICEFKSFGVEFAHPKDNCKICSCELQGNIVVPVCKRSSTSECNSPFYPGANINNEATGVVTNSLLPSISITRPTIYSGSQNQPPADSNVANQGSGSYQTSYTFIAGQSGVGPTNPFISGSTQGWNLPGQSQVSQISGYPSAEAEPITITGYNQQPPSFYAGYNLNYPGLLPSEVETLTLSGYNQNQPSYYPSSSLVYPGSVSAELASNTIQYRPNLPVRIENLGSSASEVLNPSQILSGQYGYKYPSMEGYLESQAEVSASGQSGSLQNSNSYPYSAGNYKQIGVPASSLYPSLYKRPSYEMTPLLHTAKYNWDSGSQDHTITQNLGSSNAQSQTSAIYFGKSKIKSGNPEDSESSEEET